MQDIELIFYIRSYYYFLYIQVSNYARLIYQILVI